jgi:hypothetical protein
MSSTRSEVLRLVVSVMLVDAAAIAVFFVARLGDGTARARIIFAVVWTLVTLVVVLAGLARVRESRSS